MRRRFQEFVAEAVAPRLIIIRHLPRAGWRLLLPQAVLSVTLGLLPVVFILGTSRLVATVPDAVAGGVGSVSWSRLVTAFLVASGAFFLQQILTPVHSSLGMVMKQRVDGYFHDRLIDASLRSTGIGPLEDQRGLADLREAAESLETGWRTPGDACVAMLALVVRYVRLASFGVTVGLAFSWSAAALLCASTMLIRYGHRGGLRIRMRTWSTVMAARRESAYFREVGLGAAAAKELRVFDLTTWVTGRYRASAMDYLGDMWRARRRTNIQRFGWISAAGFLVTTAVFVLLLRSAARGDLTLIQFSLALQATVGVVLLGEFYHEADDATQFGMGAVRALRDFERRVDADTVRGTGDGVSATDMPRHEVRFAGVSFTYPDATAPVLDVLDLRLRAGECTALVGLNGAGKTTLVKLLARLYEPDSGAILVDGQDIRRLPVDAWRRQIAVIFQHFNRYEVSAADNIAFGAIEHSREGAVRDAARAANIAETLDRLPRGFESPLTRTLPGGADLSGGQWQRVAIARALYAVNAGARLLVLDEPTAALDVRAEARFFDEFAELTRGLTTVLISHRFSSVRHADRIVVLERGRIIEDGRHDSLLARGGRYADLFQLQADRFRTGSDGEPTASNAIPTDRAPAEDVS